MGVEELAEDDKYFLEINLEDMETTSVEEEKLPPCHTSYMRGKDNKR